MSKISGRIMELLRLLMNEGTVTEDEVVQRLGLQTDNTMVNEQADDDLEDAAEYAERVVYDALDLDADNIDYDVPLAVRLRSVVKRLAGAFLDQGELLE